MHNNNTAASDVLTRVDGVPTNTTVHCRLLFCITRIPCTDLTIVVVQCKSSGRVQYCIQCVRVSVGLSVRSHSSTRNLSGDEIANVNFFTTTSYMQRPAPS